MVPRLQPPGSTRSCLRGWRPGAPAPRPFTAHSFDPTRTGRRFAMELRLSTAARRTVFLGAAVTALALHPDHARAQVLLDPGLGLSTVVSGLSQPIAMAFIGPDDILVTEKATGRVKRVTGGVVAATVLDLAVNSNSERGLLGIALHPEFPDVPWRVSLQHREHDRRRHQRGGQRAAARQPRRPLRLGRQHADLRPEHHPPALVPERPEQHRRIPRCRCCAATTTAACCASGPTASSTWSSATTAGAAGRRTTWRVPRPTTTSAGRRPTTRT